MESRAQTKTRPHGGSTVIPWLYCRMDYMDKLYDLQQQLQEAVEDGGFITPQKAEEMLGQLTASIVALKAEDDGPDGRIGHEDAPLDSVEALAYDVMLVCNAQSCLPDALHVLTDNLTEDEIVRLNDAVLVMRDAFDRAKFGYGVHVVPELFLALPNGNSICWSRMRHLEQVLREAT